MCTAHHIWVVMALQVFKWTIGVPRAGLLGESGEQGECWVMPSHCVTTKPQ